MSTTHVPTPSSTTRPGSISTAEIKARIAAMFPDTTDDPHPSSPVPPRTD